MLAVIAFSYTATETEIFLTMNFGQQRHCSKKAKMNKKGFVEENKLQRNIL